MFRFDNDPEFHSQAPEDRYEANAVLIKYIQPGKSNRNVYAERFNRICPNAVFNLYLLRSLNKVR